MKLMNEFYNLYTPVKHEGQAQRCILWRSMVTNPLRVDSPVRMWEIIIIMLAYLYCTAYTRMTMNESSPLCEQRRITFNEDGQRVQLARPELPAPHYICMYRLLPITPPSPSRHYYLRLIGGTNLPTPNGWIAWLAKADCTHITFAQVYYTIKFKGTGRKWTQVVGSKTNSIPVN